jgi:hypothetical protein
MKAEWKEAEHFAAFAAVLGITADSVMSTRSEDGGHFWTVFFTETPTADAKEWVWHAVIWKGDDGECEVLAQNKFRTVGQFQEEVRTLMEAAAR